MMAHDEIALLIARRNALELHLHTVKEQLRLFGQQLEALGQKLPDAAIAEAEWNALPDKATLRQYYEDYLDAVLAYTDAQRQCNAALERR